MIDIRSIFRVNFYFIPFSLALCGLALFSLTLFSLTTGVIADDKKEVNEPPHDIKRLTVGVILPLTGPIAEYGVASKNGIELARKNYPELLGAIDFVYEDSQYDPKLALSAYRKLRSDADVKIIYNWGSNPSAPLIPLAEQECFPLFAADFSTNAFKSVKCVVAFAPTSRQLGSRLVQHLNKTGLKKLGIISVENLYVNGIIDGINEFLGDDQSVVYHETVLASDSDFKTHVAKVKSKDLDAIGVLLYAGQVQGFYRNLKIANVNKPTFSSDFIESRNEIKAAGPLIQGAVYPHLKISDEYYEKYKSFYQEDSQVTSSGSAYDFALMIGELAKKNPEFYKSHLEVLPGLDGYEGVMGRYSYQDTAEHGKRIFPPIYIKKIQGEFFEVVK